MRVSLSIQHWPGSWANLSRLPASPTGRFRRTAAAFTLIELLFVLAIIGALAVVSLPAIKSMRKTNAMVSAGRQLVDDLSLARARAITDRTVVHLFFVPPDIMSWTFSALGTPEGDRDKKLGERLKSSQYTSYAVFAERSAGDQPGRPNSRFLTPWRTLPDGILISPDKFVPGAMNNPDDYSRPFEYMAVTFPTVAGVTRLVPHVSFDPQGRLINTNKQVRFQNEVIPLGRGSILYSRAPNGTLVGIDIRETPPGNASDGTNFHRVVVDGLTGRARVETPRIQ